MKCLIKYRTHSNIFYLERNDSYEQCGIKYKWKRINIYGSNAIIQNEKQIIENLELTGNESADRLIIQQCIDDNKLKSDILYDGNTVYPFEKIVKAYRKLQKSGTLDNLTKEMYHFLCMLVMI